MSTLKDVKELIEEACRDHCVSEIDREIVQECAQQAYDLGYEDAAKDPTVWYVEDHGEVFKLGDKVWLGRANYRITGFGTDENMFPLPQLNHSYHANISQVTHTPPDSWEKLQEDVFDSVFMDTESSWDECKERVGEFIDRAKKLKD